MKHIAKLREVARQFQAAPLAERSKYLQEAARLLEAEFSHDEIRERLYDALRATRYTTDGTYIYRYIRRVYDAFLIYSEELGDAGAKLYKREYTVAEDGSVTLGEAIEVRAETRFVAVASGEAVTGLVNESAADVKGAASKAIAESTVGVLSVREDAGDGTKRIKIIAPGKGSSGLYDREVLERDIPTIFPKGTHMYADHSEPGHTGVRKTRELAAVTVSEPVYDPNGPAGEGAYADIKVFSDYDSFIEERKADIGVSIDAMGTYELTEDGTPRITSLFAGNSIDFVTKAGAGGKIVTLQEAARDAGKLNASTPSTQGASPTPAGAPAGAQAPSTCQENMSNDNESPEVQALRAENARLKAEGAARPVAESLAAQSGLPPIVQARIVSEQASNPALKDGVLDTDAFTVQVKGALESEVKFATEAYAFTPAATEESPVHGMGASTSSNTAPTRENAQAAPEVQGALSLLGI